MAAVVAVSALRLGTDLWIGALGPAVVGGLLLLVFLISVGRSRTRTVRPRHFNVIEGVSALWGAVGTGIAVQAFEAGRGHHVPWGIAVMTAVVLTAPLLGCAMWLAVRSR